MASKRRLWFKFGRFISGLTIACFLLPFFGVSCEGVDVVTMSGADMVGGCEPGGLVSGAKDSAGGKDDMGGLDLKVDKVPREPLAIVALALAFGVFGLSWVRTRKAMTGAAALSLVCLGALIGLYLKVGGDLKKDIADYGKKDEAGSIGGQMMKDTKVEAGARFGLYLACMGLIAAGAISGLALKEPEGSEHDAPPSAPPPV